MIKSFKHKGLEKLFYDGSTKGIQPKHKNKLEDILDLLDAMIQIQDMNFPGSRLHKLNLKKKIFGLSLFLEIGESLLNSLIVMLVT